MWCNHSKGLSWSLQSCPHRDKEALPLYYSSPPSKLTIFGCRLPWGRGRTLGQAASFSWRQFLKARPSLELTASNTPSIHRDEILHYKKRAKHKVSLCTWLHSESSSVIYVWLCTKTGRRQKTWTQLYYKSERIRKNITLSPSKPWNQTDCSFLYNNRRTQVYIFSLSPNFWRLLFLLILACLGLSRIFCMLNMSRCGITNVALCPCHIHLEIVTIWIIALPEMLASAIPRVASPMKQKKQWLCVQCLQVPLILIFTALNCFSTQPNILYMHDQRGTDSEKCEWNMANEYDLENSSKCIL